MNDFVVATCSVCHDEMIVSEHAPEYRRYPFVCLYCKAIERLRAAPADPAA